MLSFFCYNAPVCKQFSYCTIIKTIYSNTFNAAPEDPFYYIRKTQFLVFIILEQNDNDVPF